MATTSIDSRAHWETWLNTTKVQLPDNTSQPLAAQPELLDTVASLALEPPSPTGSEACQIAADIGMDAHCMLATLAIDQTNELPKKGCSKTTLIVSQLLEGARKVSGIAAYSRDANHGSEALRRMLIAMVEDVRVVVIALAWQLAKLRQSKDADPEFRESLGRDTLEVYAPLANRLGIWQLKWELEDLAFRFTESHDYHALAKSLDEKRRVREDYIERFMQQLDTELGRRGVNAQISGRPKHIYSIWKKMQRKGVDLDGIYDIRAVRILVDEISQCYTALGVVHELFSFVRGEFDDYIATPKPNGYRSIHTAVVGPNGRIVEVQIRTQQMHEDNEYGVAAHWRYKENARESSVDSKVLWLRQLLESREGEDQHSLLEQFKNDVFEDRVYVFTPQGDVIDLPQGSTPVDFAYAVHTQVGHRCRGAKINGRIVPLTHVLQTGDQVSVLTSSKPSPSRDWLSSHLGFTQTSRARARIQRWFKEQDYDSNAQAGRAALDRELDRLGVRDASFEELADHAGYKRVSDLFAALGSGDLRMAQVIGRLRREKEPIPSNLPPSRRRKAKPKTTPGGIRVQGVGNLLTTLASCCQPVLGDAIAGYLSKARGVTVHRADCANFMRVKSDNPERVVVVDWGESASTYPVELQIEAIDRTGLFQDIVTVLANDGVNITATKSISDRENHTAYLRLTIEVTDIEALSKTLGKIQRVPNVLEVKRVTA